MYKELIEKMRCCSGQLRCGDCRFVEDCAGKEMLLNEAADAIERVKCFNALWQEAAIIAHEREPKWIPVTEELPIEIALTLSKKREYKLLEYNHKKNYWEDDEGYYCRVNYITHWMPLPEPPKKDT